MEKDPKPKEKLDEMAYAMKFGEATAEIKGLTLQVTAFRDKEAQFKAEIQEGLTFKAEVENSLGTTTPEFMTFLVKKAESCFVKADGQGEVNLEGKTAKELVDFVVDKTLKFKKETDTGIVELSSTIAEFRDLSHNLV